jgi:hypothetical protein
VGLERLGYGFRVRVSRAGETVREACGVAVEAGRRSGIFTEGRGLKSAKAQGRGNLGI